MLYQVVLLICTLSTPAGSCDAAKADNVIVAPGLQTRNLCILHGQQYIAESDLTFRDRYIKITCREAAAIA